MARIPESGDSTVVSMADYGERAKRLAGNTGAIADDLKKTRKATSLRLIETAERKKTGPHLTVVDSMSGPGERD